MLCELHLTRTTADGCLILEVCGDAGFGGVDELDHYLQVVEEERPIQVVLDLSGLEFISSLGLGRLVGFVCKAREWGGEVCLVGLKPHIRDLFDTTLLSKVIDIRETFQPLAVSC